MVRVIFLCVTLLTVIILNKKFNHSIASFHIIKANRSFIIFQLDQLETELTLVKQWISELQEENFQQKQVQINMYKPPETQVTL